MFDFVVGERLYLVNVYPGRVLECFFQGDTQGQVVVSLSNGETGYVPLGLVYKNPDDAVQAARQTPEIHDEE